MVINERLSELLFIEKRLTSSEIARNIGESTTNVDNWLKGKKGRYVIPGGDVLAKFCKTYGFSGDYILMGLGPKYSFERPPDAVANAIEEVIASLTGKIERMNDDHIQLKGRYETLEKIVIGKTVIKMKQL